MRIFVTGGSGVLGRVLLPRLLADGHNLSAPAHEELDLFSPPAVLEAMHGVQAVYHLATRIPPPERIADPGAWEENDRLRSVATRVLVDAALQTGVEAFFLPSVTFVYPAEGPADEDTPVGAEDRLQSMLDAEAELRRFGASGRRHVILRLGLLWGPGTGSDSPSPRRGATLHIEDAGEALSRTLGVPAGIYNVVADGERVSNARFKAATGWKPAH